MKMESSSAFSNSESAAEWSATGFEYRGIREDKGSIPSLSAN